GDNKAPELGGTTKVIMNGQEVIKLEMPSTPEDVDAIYQLNMDKLSARSLYDKEDNSDKTKDDYYKLFRTGLVLIWMFTNALLIIFMTSSFLFTRDNERELAPTKTDMSGSYLSVIFWSVAVLSAVRFVGSALYLILRFISYLMYVLRRGLRRGRASIDVVAV
ncbi:Chitin synthase, class 2, partial [Modicella reniformis]